ncbi:MAG: PHP domain-containing protein, partial [Cycloclasticus sp.]
MSEQLKFIHLRNHTEYSLVDGIMRVKPMVKRAAELSMPAIAVTDHVNMFAAVKFYRAALSAGVKPILGADILIKDTVEQKKPYIVTLLVQDQEGYLALSELISEAYLHGQEKGIPYLTSEKVLDNNKGLIVLSGCLDGLLSIAVGSDDHEACSQIVQRWQQVFTDRFYLEVQRVGRPGEEKLIANMVALSIKHQIAVVATNGCCFLSQAEFDAHEARVCINQGRVLSDSRRLKTHTEQQYLKTQDEMLELFSDLPEAVENTLEIAKRCNVALNLGENFLPDFPLPEGLTIDEYFAQLAEEGLQRRIDETSARIDFDAERIALYQARLKRELDVI